MTATDHVAEHLVQNGATFTNGNITNGDEKRGVFREFWNAFSDDPTDDAMMLNKDSEAIKDHDRADILEALPPLKGKRLVELGAGIGYRVQTD